MAEQCRDWAADLWQASYMGVPFFFESDDETFGRDLKAHKYPGVNDPFIEDLGRKVKFFEGTAYVTGEDADTQAIALGAALDSVGPGVLVVPILGPVDVHCEDAKRSSHKDKLGWIAFSVKFVRDGAAAASVSVPMLGQNVFDAADVASFALAGLFPGALALGNPAQYIIAAAIGEVQSVAAAIELVRIANPVSPAISARVASVNVAIAAAAPRLIAYGDPAASTDLANLLASAPALDHGFADPVASLVAVTIANIRRLGDGMAASTDAGAGALLGLALDFPVPAIAATLAPNAAAAAANTAAIVNVARVAALVAWCEALERQPYVSRPDGVAARAAAAERLGDELANWIGAANVAVYVALEELQGAVVAFLTQLIADLAPVVTVTAPQARPALWWAWRLYQDPRRAADLVLRNQVRHPSFMPTEFQALAPGFTPPAALPTAWPQV